jgi:hypothetical protein
VLCCAAPAGVGDSLVEFAKAKGVDMVAVGSRGMGSVKRSLMSLVGLGSVSDYVLHQLHVPVLVVHAGQGAAAAAAGAPRDGQVRGDCAACGTNCRACSYLKNTIIYYRADSYLNAIIIYRLRLAMSSSRTLLCVRAEDN